MGQSQSGQGRTGQSRAPEGLDGLQMPSAAGPASQHQICPEPFAAAPHHGVPCPNLYGPAPTQPATTQMCNWCAGPWFNWFAGPWHCNSSTVQLVCWSLALQHFTCADGLLSPGTATTQKCDWFCWSLALQQLKCANRLRAPGNETVGFHPYGSLPLHLQLLNWPISLLISR